ncbi:hypothetical protein [Peptoniphilus duerdenii]|uniref:hypothetical protein n=1 Tax=Peptoniphilus duerdenii TaxID=507750 RepID=UPI00288A3575|nr:hypothetical protein [Peptoniphilus duerdenii]
MTELKTLIKKDLKSFTYRIFNLRTNDGKGRRKRILNIFLSVVLTIYIIGLFGVVALSAITEIAKTEAGYMVMIQLFLGMGIFLLIFYMVAFMSAIFYSNEVKMLMTLPIKRENILFAKALSMGIIFYIIFGIYASFVYIPYANAGFNDLAKILPVTMLVIGSVNFEIAVITIVVSVLMRYLNQFRSTKYIFQVVGFTLLMGFSIGIQFVVNSAVTKNLAVSNGIEKVASWVPQIFFLKVILEKNIGIAIIMGILALVLGSGILYIFSKVSTGFVFKAINLENSKDSHKKRIKAGANTKESVAKTLMKRDLLNIVKTPIYIFNIGIGGLLIVVFGAFGIFSSVKTTGAIPKFGVLADFVDSILNTPAEEIIISAGAFFLLASIVSLTSNTALTSFTREGRQIWLTQTLPISAKEQVKGRVRASMVLQGLNMIPTLLLVFFLVGFRPMAAVGALVGLFIGMFFIANLAMIVGSIKPKLDWDNPQQAVKRNGTVMVFNLGFIGYIILAKFIILDILPKYMSLKSLGGPTKIVAVVLVVHLVAAVVMYMVAPNVVKKRMRMYN